MIDLTHGIAGGLCMRGASLVSPSRRARTYPRTGCDDRRCKQVCSKYVRRSIPGRFMPTIEGQGPSV